jgi:hypothetical protein
MYQNSNAAKFCPHETPLAIILRPPPFPGFNRSCIPGVAIPKARKASLQNLHPQSQVLEVGSKYISFCCVPLPPMPDTAERHAASCHSHATADLASSGRLRNPQQPPRALSSISLVLGGVGIDEPHPEKESQPIIRTANNDALPRLSPYRISRDASGRFLGINLLATGGPLNGFVLHEMVFKVARLALR